MTTRKRRPVPEPPPKTAPRGVAAVSMRSAAERSGLDALAETVVQLAGGLDALALRVGRRQARKVGILAGMEHSESIRRWDDDEARQKAAQASQQARDAALWDSDPAFDPRFTEIVGRVSREEERRVLAELTAEYAERERQRQAARQSSWRTQEGIPWPVQPQRSVTWKDWGDYPDHQAQQGDQPAPATASACTQPAPATASAGTQPGDPAGPGDCQHEGQHRAYCGECGQKIERVA